MVKPRSGAVSLPRMLGRVRGNDFRFLDGDRTFLCFIVILVLSSTVNAQSNGSAKSGVIIAVAQPIKSHPPEILFDPASVGSNSDAGLQKNSLQKSQTNDKAVHVLQNPAPAGDSLSVADTRTHIETASEAEHHSSMKIYFILLVIGLSSLVVHVLNVLKCHFLPESIAVIFVGGLIGYALKLSTTDADALTRWKQEAFFPPTAFFLLMLPPIIFESGYNLQKGAFFQNIGSILVFAIFGTLISAVIIGVGVFLLGIMEVVYPLRAIECFEFGAIISAVDPVATIAIFKALNVHPTLHMLVFGESILNDAVAIVLASTIQELGQTATNDTVIGASSYRHSPGGFSSVFFAFYRFLTMFFASALLGVVFGLFSALALKHINFRRQPALEFAVMLIFSYMPYGLAEGINLSGIMAILTCGIVMSHYTHYNLSPATQITMQQTLRSLAFMAETCVFAYLGLALMSFQPSDFHFSLIFWSIVLILAARAANIYPLARVVNRYRTHQKISKQMMFIMWFSGLRGAIAYALALHMEFDAGDKESGERRQVIVTTVLAIVLFTTVVMGGATSPVLKYLRKYHTDNEFDETDDTASIETDEAENDRSGKFADNVAILNGGTNATMLSSSHANEGDEEVEVYSAHNGSRSFRPATDAERRKQSHRRVSRNRHSSKKGVVISKTYESDEDDEDVADDFRTRAMRGRFELIHNNNNNSSATVNVENVVLAERLPQNTTLRGGHERFTNGFERFDTKYLRPIFLRQYSTRELLSGERMLRRLTAAGSWVRAQLGELGEELGDAYSRSRSRIVVSGGSNNNPFTPEPTTTVRYSSRAVTNDAVTDAAPGVASKEQPSATPATAIMIEVDQ